LILYSGPHENLSTRRVEIGTKKNRLSSPTILHVRPFWSAQVAQDKRRGLPTTLQMDWIGGGIWIFTRVDKFSWGPLYAFIYSKALSSKVRGKYNKLVIQNHVPDILNKSHHHAVKLVTCNVQSCKISCCSNLKSKYFPLINNNILPA